MEKTLKNKFKNKKCVTPQIVTHSSVRDAWPHFGCHASRSHARDCHATHPCEQQSQLLNLLQWLLLTLFALINLKCYNEQQLQPNNILKSGFQWFQLISLTFLVNKFSTKKCPRIKNRQHKSQQSRVSLCQWNMVRGEIQGKNSGEKLKKKKVQTKFRTRGFLGFLKAVPFLKILIFFPVLILISILQ